MSTEPGRAADETLRAERFVAEGRVLARRSDGRIVLVRGALPSEVVTVREVRRRGGAELAEVDTIVETSPGRVHPPCPRRTEGCGGCDWQHLEVESQLEAKTAVAVDALRRTARLPDASVVPRGRVHPEGTRTTIRVVGRPGGVGYRRDESHEVVDATGCLVAHPSLRDLLERIEVAPGVEVTMRCSIATGERCATWDGPPDAVTGLPADVRTGTDAWLTEVVHHGPTARRTVPAGSESPSTRLRVSAGSFFQSGPVAAGLLVDAVARAAPELVDATTVVDLYGGVGLFAASVAPMSAHLVLVEANRTAVADARRNLAAVERFTVATCDVGRWDARRSGVRRADVVIADPPRAGLGRRGVDVVAGVDPTTVVLVSCDPVAAARDAALLADVGYEHAGAEVFDLFGWTHHVETVTRYVRSGPSTRGADR